MEFEGQAPEVQEQAQAEDGTQQEEENFDDLGEDYNESDYQEDQTEEEGEEGEEGEGEEDSKPTRTVAETKQLAAEFYGVDPSEVVVKNDGSVRLVMKINGRKRLVSPTEFKKGFNLNQAGYERLNSVKAKEKQMEAFWRQAKENPNVFREVMSRLGHDPRELAKHWLEEAVEEYDMTPEERRQKEIERKLEEYERREKEREEKDKQAQLAQQREQLRGQYTQDLIKAVQAHGFKDSSVKDKGQILMSAVQKMIFANQRGQSLTANDAVALAKEEWQNSVVGMFNDISEDQIINVIPDRLIKAIRKADLNNLRRGTPLQQEEDYGQPVDLEEYEEAAPAPSRRGAKKIGLSDYFSTL